MPYPSVTIRPFDYKGNMIARSNSLLQEFKHLGFVERAAFLEVVTSIDDSFSSHKDIMSLISFWNYRCMDIRVIDRLEQVMEKLKKE